MQFVYTHKNKIIGILAVVVLFSLWLFMRAPESAEAPERVEVENDVQQEGEENAPLDTATTEDVRVVAPIAGASVASPLTISGEARGYWYFEGSFPLVVVDWDGLVIGEGYATAQGDWMTYEYVSFVGEVSFDVSKISGEYSRNGALIVQKANPSGLPEHAAAVELPIVFAQ